MEEVCGTSLDKVLDTLLDRQLQEIGMQLKIILTRMSVAKSKTLGSVTGGPFRNLIAIHETYQPKQRFFSVTDFYDHFRWVLAKNSPKERADLFFARLPRNAAIQFAHGDLLPKNIMVDGSTITGIIDWGHAGYYPSFWEYCCIHNPNFITPNWSKVLGVVFPGEAAPG